MSYVCKKLALHVLSDEKNYYFKKNKQMSPATADFDTYQDNFQKSKFKIQRFSASYRKAFYSVVVGNIW